MHSIMSALKSQMFLQAKQNIFVMPEKNVDNGVKICLNVTNMAKTLTENSSPQKPFAENRWLVQTGKGAGVDLIPESGV